MPRFNFDQPVADVPDSEMTFAEAGDLRFSDLGPKRAQGPEAATRLAQANAEATWRTTCPRCNERLTGSLEDMKAHACEP